MGDSRSRCSYPNGYNYSPDGRLHATWVWRESSQGSNHDLMYAYIIFGTRRTPAKLADGHLHSEGDLAIAAATAASGWADWRVVHVEKGPFVNEMLGDNYRWDKEGVLSVMVQQSPERAHQPTPLRILDFSLEEK